MNPTEKHVITEKMASSGPDIPIDIQNMIGVNMSQVIEDFIRSMGSRPILIFAPPETDEVN